MAVDLVFTVAPAEVKLRPTFWFEEQVRLFNVLYPLLRRTILDAAKAALEDLLEMGVGIEWDLVNTQVVRWIHDYVTDLSSGITSTSSRYVQEAVADWIGSGQHLDELVDILQPMFGEVRARMIATTEVTRAYSEGNQATWRASGVVDGKRWNTAVDELVCPICEPLDGMEIGLEEDGFTTEAGDIGLTGPPAHPSCRCWLSPVVKA
jgi:SPP1 gp7 family putative phage head morphogenesis protein